MQAASEKEVSEVKVEMAEGEKTLNAKILDHDKWLSGEILATKERLAATEKSLVEVEKDILLLTKDATGLVANNLAAIRKWKAEYEKLIARAEGAVADIEEQIARKTTWKKIQKTQQTRDSIVSAMATLAETKKWMDGYEEYVENIKRYNHETEELIAKRPDTTLPWKERVADERKYCVNMGRIYTESAMSSLEAYKRKYNHAEFLEQVARAEKANAVIEEQMGKTKNAAVKTTGQKSKDELTILARNDEQVAKNETLTTTGQTSTSCEEIAMSRRAAGDENKENGLKKKAIRQKSIAMSSRDEFDDDDEFEEQMAKMKNRPLTTTGQISEDTTSMSRGGAGEEKKEKRRKKKKTIKQKSQDAIAMNSMTDEFDDDEFEDQIARLAATLAKMHEMVSLEDKDANKAWYVEIEGPI